MADLRLGRSNFGDPSHQNRVLSTAEAMSLLEDWVPNERLRLHMLQVGELMRQWALEREHLPETEAHKWWLAGVLHDADWEKYPDQHCRRIIEELEQRGTDPSVIRTIACHGPQHFGVEPETNMEKMIYVFDELSGFIHAAALIRPTRYEGMDVKSVLKKLKTPSFAAQVNREEINDAISRTALTLEEVIEFILRCQISVRTQS